MDVTLIHPFVDGGSVEFVAGTCWCGGTVWQGRRAMRISVSSWRTSDGDVERSLEAILRVARETASSPA